MPSKIIPSFFTIKKGFFENLPSIVFTTLSVPLTGDRNPSRKGKDVIALRCAEPLRYKVGGPIKGLARFCGLGPPGNSSL